MKMKKLIALTLALVLCLSVFAGCQPAADSDKPVLKIALSPDFSPMEFVDPSKSGQDKFVGFDVSLSKYIAQELDMTLEIMPMDFDACQAAVASGKVDITSPAKMKPSRFLSFWLRTLVSLPMPNP